MRLPFSWGSHAGAAWRWSVGKALPPPEAGQQASRLPPAHLALLLEDAAALRADAKHVSDLLADALHRRYGAIATERRRTEGKDTGRVHFLDAGFEITADLPKRVEWDRVLLADAVETIRGWGEDPADYVATEIKVAEGRFTAWPPKLQALFQPARTVGTGRPSYSLEQVEW